MRRQRGLGIAWPPDVPYEVLQTKAMSVEGIWAPSPVVVSFDWMVFIMLGVAGDP